MRDDILRAKAEIDAAWDEAVTRAKAAVDNVEQARTGSHAAKAEHLRMTEAALFAHNRWCNAVQAAVRALDAYFDEASLFPVTEG